MLAEIKWVGSKRLENTSGHRINRPPFKTKYMREKTTTKDESIRTNIQLELAFLRKRIWKVEKRNYEMNTIRKFSYKSYRAYQCEAHTGWRQYGSF